MRFEVLPNEILIECFEYLNAFEIFSSFDQLNDRLSHLIRTIPLHLNFQHVRKTIFDQFCRTIQFNPELKHQIYSLKLSNKDTCEQMERFLSFFSLDQFTHLRSLTLVQIEQNNLEKIKSTLPFLQNLYSFRLIRFVDPKYEENDLLTALPLSKLRILSIPILTHTDQTSIITHLSISGCSLDQLVSSLFKYAPFLKYLNIENIYKTSQSTPNPHYHSALHLKQLIIKNFEYSFEEFQILVKLTSNLQSLTISALDNICMIDANAWKSLIQSSLSYLKIFRFTFGCYCRGQTRADIIEKFKHFQNEFWSEQHPWFTEYVFDDNSAVIYTVPYASNTYRLTLSIGRYSNQLRDQFHTFDNVTDLMVCHEAMREKYLDYFSSVTSLNLKVNTRQNEKQILDIEYIKSLKMILNFYHLKYLDISSYFAIETSSLLEICKEAPHLVSITINPLVLSRLLNDDELCEYLNRMIRKLDIYKFDQNSFKNSNEIEEFCQKFSNVEQLICGINQLDQLLLLLNQSSKLSLITVFLTSMDNLDEFLVWWKNQASNFNMNYRIHQFLMYSSGHGELYKTELCIWTDGKRDQ